MEITNSDLFPGNSDLVDLSSTHAEQFPPLPPPPPAGHRLLEDTIKSHSLRIQKIWKQIFKMKSNTLHILSTILYRKLFWQINITNELLRIIIIFLTYLTNVILYFPYFGQINRFESLSSVFWLFYFIS